MIWSVCAATAAASWCGLSALIKQPDDVGRVWRERLTGSSQADPTARAFEQFASEFTREPSQRRGDRRLRDDELLSGTRHRSVPDHRQQCPQLRDSHRHLLETLYWCSIRDDWLYGLR